MTPCTDLSTYAHFMGSGWDQPGPEWVTTLRYGACTPMRPDWRRKQCRRDWLWSPRTHAALTWCAIPAEYDDWGKFWTGPKGTGEYRYREPCFYGVRVLIGPNLVPRWLPVGSGPGFTNGYPTCADDWWDVSPGWTRCAP